MHRVQTSVQLILDRLNVDLRLIVGAVVHNLHLIDLILVIVQALPGTLGFALEPRAPDEEGQATGHIHDIDHPLSSLLRLVLPQHYEMREQTEGKPAAEDDYEGHAHPAVKGSVNLRGCRRRQHGIDTHSSCISFGFTFEGPADCGPLPRLNEPILAHGR